jgi:ABC-type glycerol-3-phosphate transport system substrate-binding protein
MDQKHINQTARGLGVVLLTLVAIVLSGCGLVSSQQPEPVTITFSFPEIDNDFYEPRVLVYNQEHPNTTIELRPLPGNAMGSLDPSQTDALAASVYVLREWQIENQILGLNSVIEQDVSFIRSDYLPGTVDFLSLGGETWAIPVGADMEVMFFNKDLFDQSGLPYPELGWDWDDFLFYALTINDPDNDSDRVYGYTTTPGYQDVYSFIYEHGGRMFNDIVLPSAPVFNDPLTVEAVEYYADLFHLHRVAPTPEEARRAFGGTRYAYYEAIRSGSIGMWSMPISQRGGLNWPEEWSGNWAIAPLPMDAVQFSPFWVEEGYAVSAATSNPDECWQWINFLTHEINPRLVPTRQSLLESDAFEQKFGEDAAKVVRQSLEFAVPVSLWQWFSLGNAIDTFNHAIEEVVNGELEPQEALDFAQEQAESSMP